MIEKRNPNGNAKTKETNVAIILGNMIMKNQKDKMVMQDQKELQLLNFK